MQQRKARDAKRLLDQDGVVSSNCLEYPPFQSFSDKTDIICEWQVEMNPNNLSRSVCAVCAQVFDVKALCEVTPSEEMLIVLHTSAKQHFWATATTDHMTCVQVCTGCTDPSTLYNSVNS